MSLALTHGEWDAAADACWSHDQASLLEVLHIVPVRAPSSPLAGMAESGAPPMRPLGTIAGGAS